MTGLDPAVFKPDAIDPETAAFNTQLRDVLAAAPSIDTLEPTVVRAQRAEGRGPMGPLVFSDMAVDRHIAGPGGRLRLRTFVPETVNAVYLHIHGGGWVLGSADAQDPLLEQLARRSSVAIVSVDYRLAPEHPYPAGPDDCEAAALWLADHAQSEFGSARLLIGGESAGAHLSVVTLLRLRDKHQFSGVLAANLTFGVYDLAQTPSAARGHDALVVPTNIMLWFARHFAPPERWRDADVSPLYADLSGLPPALFSVGTLDPLLDDTLFMYSRWLAAGNQADLAVYPGGAHGFNGHPIALGRQMNERCHAFLRETLA